MDSEGESLGVGQEGSNGHGRADEERTVREFVDPWVAEAQRKGLPEEFIERLEASDGVTEAEKARIVASVDTAADLAERRRKAVEHGRALGTHEADSRRETGSDREQRIRRAMAYAAWEFDGKPLSSKHQREEFGVLGPDVTPSLERALAAQVRKDRK